MCQFLWQTQQLIILLLINQLFLQSLSQKVNNFPILRRLRGQNVNLILPLNQYLKGSNKLQGFSIDLQGDNLTPTLGLQLHTLPLPQPKRLLHSNLHLPHMQHIAKPDNLNQPITKRRIPQSIPTITPPQTSYPSSPIINIQKDYALELFDVYLSVIDEELEMLR